VVPVALLTCLPTGHTRTPTRKHIRGLASRLFIRLPLRAVDSPLLITPGNSGPRKLPGSVEPVGGGGRRAPGWGEGCDFALRSERRRTAAKN
jgi:hypothetical protein